MLLASAALALPTNTLALPTRTSALSTSATNSSRGCPVRASTTVLIYNETGAGGTGEFSGQWETAFWSEWAASDGRVQWQAIDAAGVQKCAVADLSSVAIWVQPGGNAYGYSQSMGAAGRALVNGFLAAGGAYVGTCAGFYYASRGYYWEMDTQWSDKGYWAYPTLLSAFDADTEGSIVEIEDEEGPDGVFRSHAATKITVDGNATHTVVYYGGPTVGLHRTPSRLPAGATARAVFDDVPGTPPAIVTVSRPGLELVLFSPHLEAHEGIGGVAITSAQRAANYELRRAFIAPHLRG